ncbi:MAG: hypothetical protein IJ681_09680 [Bacteroidales bacterium]|nr:hypothetical protein [Bacteroidales bacterium]
MKRKILTILSISLIYCNLFAQKEATEFLNNQRSADKKDIVYFKGANELIKTNLTAITGLSDTAVLNTYNREIINSLKFYGFEVREVTNFPIELKNNEHTLEVSQMEAEQYAFYDSVIDEFYPKLKFYKQLNGVNINVWLTYNAQKDEDRLVFFNEEQIQDAIDGYFECTDKDECFVNYETVSVIPNDVYLIAFNNARNSARYFFNFLLNRYVFIKTEGKDKNYYGISEIRTLISRKHPFSNFDIVE